LEPLSSCQVSGGENASHGEAPVAGIGPVEAELSLGPRCGKSRYVQRQALREHLLELLVSLCPDPPQQEQRGEQRYPFPCLIRLVPIGGDLPQGEPVTVVGKHLSLGGLGFFHPEPITARRVVVWLERPDGQQVELLMELTWCRFTTSGWYESGGRFLRLVRDNEPIA